MNAVFASRASDGVRVYKGVESPQVLYEQIISRKELKENGLSHISIKFAEFSPNGHYFVYCDGEKTLVLRTDTWQPHMILDGEHAKTSAVCFSPKSSHLCTWRTLFVAAPNQTKQSHNFHIIDLNAKKIVAEFMDKNRQKWQPHWTEDENICARLVGSELLFHENNNFAKYVHKLVLPKMADYALSSLSKNLHIAAYIPIGKDTPAIVKVFQYPNFQHVVAAKTFFKADRVSMNWNKRGTALIIMAIVDIDSTGQSYYGEQNLYFVSTNGDSYMVPLGKNGPVYWVEWSPQSNCYCVVYGYMPAKATLYNLKGDVIYDFGTGPRNEAHYDPFGKVLCICGFGNLRGNMEFFNSAAGLENKRLCSLTAEDTTMFKWCPDGVHFLTATTAPRLRVHNGWKVWRYDGTIVEQFVCPENEELWDVSWRPDSNAQESPILQCKNAGSNVKSNSDALAGVVNSSGAYVPPHLRSATNKQPTFKLHQYELPSNEKAAEKNNDSKQAGKNRKKSEAKKTKANDTNVNVQTVPQIPAKASNPTQSPEEIEIKKIRSLAKKLEQIEALKEKIKKGEKLELNQMQKIEKEAELCEELANLGMSS